MKCIADELNLTKSKKRIEKLTYERDGFYTSLLAEDYSVTNERMGSHAEVEYIMAMIKHVFVTIAFQITFVVSWIPSNTLLANFFYFLNEEFKNHSMFVSLTMRDVHHSWLSFVCNIPAWSVEAFTRIIAKAGLWGLRQAYIDDINVYNDPDVSSTMKLCNI